MTVLCVVLLGGGVALLGYGLLELKRATESLHWPMLTAHVVSSAIEQDRGGHSGTIYSPVVRYKYEHEGVSYEGKRIMFSGQVLSTHSREDAERFISQFEAGARITVRVSPSNPRISVVEPGVDRRVWITLFVSVMFIIMGGGGLLGIWK
jgi:hypothetical protein